MHRSSFRPADDVQGDRLMRLAPEATDLKVTVSVVSRFVFVRSHVATPVEEKDAKALENR